MGSFLFFLMDCLGVSSVQNLQALSALLSTPQEDDDDEDYKVRYLSLSGSKILD